MSEPAPTECCLQKCFWMRFGAFLAVIILWGLGERLYDRFWDSALTLTFFDVGQGDSTLIQLPGGKTMLVDAGGGMGRSDVGERVLVRELSHLGILTLDSAVLSHPDKDHGFGFLGLFSDLSIKEWVVSASKRHQSNSLYQELMKMARLEGSEIRKISLATKETLNGAELAWLPDAANLKNRNDQSLVLKITYAGCSVLLAGDIEKKRESLLLKEPVSAHLLKVPHHGSRTSSTLKFLRKVSPQWAVFSAGPQNRYGHPHEEILERYLGEKVRVFRTDYHGFVRFRISKSGEVRCQNSFGDCGSGRCGIGVL